MSDPGPRSFPLPDSAWRTIAEQAADAVFVTDESLGIVWVNRRACELLARDEEHLIGHRVTDFFWKGPEQIARMPLRDKELRAGMNTVTTREFETGRGERRVLEVHARSIGSGRLVGIARDVTEQVAALERLRQSEESFRTLIEWSPEAAIVHVDGKMRYVNRAALRILGYTRPDELLGKSVMMIVHADERASIMSRLAALRTGERSLPFVEERLLRKDGTTMIASIGAVKVVFEGEQAVAAMGRDVTEQRTIESQLVRTERMAALGMLSAGVAHEVNNPLGYLMLRLGAIQAIGDQLRRAIDRAREGGPADVEMLDSTDDLFSQFDDHVRTALEGAERVRTIVNDLRVFSRPEDAAQIVISVRGPLDRAVALAGHDLRYRARVITQYDDVPPVLASEGRLTQVFLNLLLNAGQAIEEGDPEKNEVHIRAFAEGENVCVAIRDTGAGISPEHMRRLFQPFFTTKPPGVGTGLGLSICHGIVTALGGTIRVESTVGVGTTFTVVLPRAKEDS